MEINKTCNLFLNNIYSYDIVSCHYQILKKMGFNVSGINYDDKLERNKSIGLIFRDNPILSQKVRDVTNSTISQYLKINDINENELILRQYDGILITRKLQHTNEFIELPLKEKYDVFIISYDRSKYIAHGKEIVIKGVPYLYNGISEYYKKLLNLNYISKKMIFLGLQNIKESLNKSNNINDFTIPLKDDKYKIFLIGYGEMDISENMIKLVDTEEIDREKYFDLYLKQFTKSIVKEFI